ncbi:MAG: GGDEF domain-containing protein [Candidatus Eisenbacteria bacterium]|nr:GGDEF domain-containing protein [Candidatus Eisenbacteria bacterium]
MTVLNAELLLDSIPDGVYATDRHRRITYWNPAAERITGYSRAEVVGSRCSDGILQHVDERGQELCTGHCPLAAAVEDGGTRESHVYLHHKQGHRVPVTVRVSPIRDSSGMVIGAIEVFSEDNGVHDLLRDLSEARREARVDELTDAGNRKACELTLRDRLARLAAHGIPFGIVFLDVDHFKFINDAFGHQVGDHVLLMVARTAERSVRPRDVVTRRGGDEFVIVLDNVTASMLVEIAERIRMLIEQSFITHEGTRISVTASLGATLGVPDDTPDTIIARADGLMYQSKESGRNLLTVG